jgi:hypothetical protein
MNHTAIRPLLMGRCNASVRGTDRVVDKCAADVHNNGTDIDAAALQIAIWEALDDSTEDQVVLTPTPDPLRSRCSVPLWRSRRDAASATPI